MNFIASHPDLVRATYPELKETELLRAVERALESIFKFLLTAAFWRKWIRAGFSIGSGKVRDRKKVPPIRYCPNLKMPHEQRPDP